MEFSQISESLQRDAAWVVFLNVFLQQAGLPIPAVPTMLLAGSLAVSSGQFASVLAAAVVASVFADWIWYVAGKIYGYRVLSGLCRLSINPGSCVSQTEARFVRWGLPSLVIAKFIPGFSTVAPPIAGSLSMALPGFLLATGIGAALWAGLALGTGWIFRREVQTVIDALDRHTGSALLAAAGMVACWLCWKFWQKLRFQKLAAVPHIMPDELLDAIEAGRPVLVLDLRGHSLAAKTGPVAGTIVAEHGRLLDAVGMWPKDQPIVAFCACPEDASAIMAARSLLNQGYLSVRILKGGYDAWLAATTKKS